MIRYRSGAGLILGLALLCCPAPARADLVVDRDLLINPANAVGLAIHRLRSDAYLVSVGQTGTFARIDLQVDRMDETLADLKVDLLAFESLAGTDIVLATRTIAAADVPVMGFGSVLTTLDFEAENLAVQAGDTLFIRLSSAADPALESYYWAAIVDTPNPFGALYTQLPPDPGFYSIDFYEVGVRTYVRTAGTTAAVPEPSSIALAGVGLVGLAGWATRRRRPA